MSVRPRIVLGHVVPVPALEALESVIRGGDVFTASQLAFVARRFGVSGSHTEVGHNTPAGWLVAQMIREARNAGTIRPHGPAGGNVDIKWRAVA